MVRILQEEEYVRLGRLDVRVLVALLKGKMSAYEVGKQCELDSNNEIPVGNGSLAHTLKSLEAFMMIKKTELYGSRTQTGYQITNIGRQALTNEVVALQHLVTLTRERAS